MSRSNVATVRIAEGAEGWYLVHPILKGEKSTHVVYIRHVKATAFLRMRKYFLLENAGENCWNIARLDGLVSQAIIHASFKALPPARARVELFSRVFFSKCTMLCGPARCTLKANLNGALILVDVTECMCF